MPKKALDRSQNPSQFSSVRESGALDMVPSCPQGCGQINRKKATAAAATRLIVVGSVTSITLGPSIK
jgi:hypothetical protein